MKANSIFICRVLSVVVTAGMVGFILWNSSQTGSVSGARSTGILTFFQESLRFPISEFFVRKTAHFLEFCVFGILVGGTVRCYTRSWLARITIPLFVGLLIPVCDEFLQTFIPGRSGEVRDVLIDFAGAATGIFLVSLATFLVDRRRSRKRELMLWKS